MSLAEKSSPQPAIDAVLQHIAAAISSIRFGSIELVIHDGRVVQIEKREKTRIEPSR